MVIWQAGSSFFPYNCKNVIWKAVDSSSAQVTLTDGGRSVSASMPFDEASRLVNLSTMRYREIEGKYALTPWSVPMTETKKLAGLNLPVRGLVTWNLPTGDLPYYDWQVTEVQYNRDKK